MRFIVDLIIIDGNSLANRAFYAMPPLKNKSGLVCNAIFGFCNILVKLITENNPKYFAVAFDAHKPTFRHEKYAEYKAGRNAMPEDLVTQMPLLQNLLRDMGIKVLIKDGIEADDIVGTLAKRFNLNSVIVSGDKDLLQLVDENTTVWLTRKGISETEVFDLTHFRDVYGFEPPRMVDLKAMMGDSSDNIPGIAGVGEKTALEFMHSYGSLDNLYAHIDELKGAKHDKVANGRDMAYLSYELATIDTNSEIECTIDELSFHFPFSNVVKEKFADYEFTSLLKRDIFDDGAEIVKEHSNTCENVEVATLEQLREIVKNHANADTFVAHYEKYYDALHFAFDLKTNYFISLNNVKENTKQYFDLLVPFIQNDKIDKVYFKYKKQKHFFAKFGIDINMPCFDIALAQYIIDPSVKFEIIDKAFDYLGLDINFMGVGILQAKDILKPKIDDLGLRELYYNLELKLEDVLFDMEKEGIKVDRNILLELTKNFSAQIENIVEQIYALAGEKFNINSTQQLAEILFDKLRIPLPKNKKRSTNIEILQEIENEHPIVPLLMRYRKVQKIVSTYLDGLVQHLDNNDIIHTEFNQTMATTGRLSSVNPNLQNIPTRDDEGKSLRKMFVVKSDDNIFISADYSQIELRLLAHYSQDEKLVKAFKTGHDIHIYTASEIFHTPIDEVTPSMRRIAKTVNFGIIYGMSDFGLAQGLQISRKEAKHYIETYFEKYSGVKVYMENCVEQARKEGFVSTMFGRKRYIPELQSKNKIVEKLGERIAMNSPLQGSESDIIKIAMINIANKFKEFKLQSKLILQIHDELIVEAKESEKNIVSKILKEEMENVVTLNVPLTVDLSCGKSWFDL